MTAIRITHRNMVFGQYAGDSAWQGNPLMWRTMQAYPAAAETANQLFADADLDGRDAEKMRFVLDYVVEGMCPSNKPVITPLDWKTEIDTRGLTRGPGSGVRPTWPPRP